MTVTTQGTSNTTTSYAENGTYTVTSPQLTGGVPTGGSRSGTANFTHDMAWDWSNVEDTTYNYTNMSGSEHEEHAETHTFNATGSFSFTNQQVSNLSSTWTKTDTWSHERTWTSTICSPMPASCYPYNGSEISSGSNTTSGSGYNPYYQPEPPDNVGAAAGSGGDNAGAGAGGAGNANVKPGCEPGMPCTMRLDPPKGIDDPVSTNGSLTGWYFNPDVSIATMFPIAEAFVSGGEMVIMMVPGPTGGGRAPIRPRAGGGGCFVADTLVVMVRPATREILAATDAQAPDDESGDKIAWRQFGLGATVLLLGLAVGTVYIWRSTRRRLSAQEQLADAVLAETHIGDMLSREWQGTDDDPMVEPEIECDLVCNDSDR